MSGSEVSPGFLLAIDQGNSQTVAGLYPWSGVRTTLSPSTPLVHWRIATDVRRTADETSVMLETLVRREVELDQVRAVAIASVVPPATAALVQACQRLFPAAGEPLLERPRHAQQAGLRIGYPEPNEVGIDILCNCIAVLERFGPPPAIVVDFGTAMTFAVVDATGAFVGGVIAPGVETARSALFQRTAQLPMVELAAPARLIGGSTTEAIQAGLVFGAAGQVDGLVARLEREMGAGGKPRVVATGGLARLVAPHTQVVDAIEPFLTLDGVRLVYQRRMSQPQI